MVYDDTKYLMKKYNITADKSMGQNFLIDDDIINKIVEKAEVSENDLIIEIGPGLGTLTKELLEKAKKVIVIELDKRMIQILEDRFVLYNNIKIINDDILNIDLNRLIKDEMQNSGASFAKIVANLPYYITTPIIMKLLEEKIKIESITVMVQKEVAERLCEIPGGKNTGAITYTVYYYSEPTKIVEVSKESFIPIPKVDSEVINLKIRKEPNVKVKNEENFFKLIKFSFMQRRKTLINSLSKCDLFKNKEEIKEIILKIGLNEKVRGENLGIEQFAEIANNLK